MYGLLRTSVSSSAEGLRAVLEKKVLIAEPIAKVQLSSFL
jgi:hypothetical protein